MDVNALRSALDAFRRQDVRSLSSISLEAELVELDAATRAIALERARRVAEVERRGAFARDGHLSMTSWVEARFGTTYAQAAREVRVARALEHMPAVREALAGGEVSESAVGTLVMAREANPSAYDRAETELLDTARALPLRGLRRAVERWKASVEPDLSAAEAAARFERRCFGVANASDGMVRVEGNLDPESGNTLVTALSAVMDGWARSGEEDPRTPAQRRADALSEVCRGWLDRGDRPLVAGERPHVTVVVDLETLRGVRAGGSATAHLVGSAAPGTTRPVGTAGPGTTRAAGSSGRKASPGVRSHAAEAPLGVGPRVSETSHGTLLPPETARRLACDAAISRVVVSGRSEPLEAGRTTRVISPAIRRALTVRDGGCAFPGCDRPPGWCDAHHVRHWVDGGRTDLANLVLLCRRHHRMTHDRFRVRMIDGRPVFSRDGVVLGPRAAAPNLLSPTADRAPP